MGYRRGALAAALATALVAMCASAIATEIGAKQAAPPQAVTQQAAPAQDAATRRQSEHTERANRDAAVADETGAAAQPRTASPDPSAGPRTNGAATGLSYGPVLAPRGQQGQDPARKDPAEVHDETDTLARPAPQSGQESGQQPGQQPGQQAGQQRAQPTRPQNKPQNKPVTRRREAWQPAVPMAPRPLRSADAAPASEPVPIPAPVPGPQPIVPGSSPVNCVGGLCTIPSGGNVNLGVGNAGVNGNGRLCARTGPNVQCF